MQYITINKNEIEGMLQYIEDEVYSGNIKSHKAVCIIENLINEEGINDLNLIEMVKEYSEKYKNIINRY